MIIAQLLFCFVHYSHIYGYLCSYIMELTTLLRQCDGESEIFHCSLRPVHRSSHPSSPTRSMQALRGMVRMAPGLLAAGDGVVALPCLSAAAFRHHTPQPASHLAFLSPLFASQVVYCRDCTFLYVTQSTVRMVPWRCIRIYTVRWLIIPTASIRVLQDVRSSLLLYSDTATLLRTIALPPLGELATGNNSQVVYIPTI
jgi:hypothetical protein